MKEQVKNRRILYVVRSFPTWSETFIWDKIRFLRDNGFDLKLFSLTRGERAWSEEECLVLNKKEDVDYLVAGGEGEFLRAATRFVKDFCAFPLHALLWFFASRKSSFLAEDWLKRWRRFLAFDRWRPDLVHVHYAHTAYGFLSWKKYRQSKWVVSLLGYDVTRYEGRMSEEHKRVFHEADILICTSLFLKETTISLGAPEKKIRILPTGVNLSRFPFYDRSQRKRKDMIILTVARLVWEKGHEDALQAIAHLIEKKNIRYVMIGAGPLLEKLKRLSRDLNIETHVEFRRALDWTGVRNALEEADIFLLPSRLEAFGAALVEAQATGLPVVATRIGGIPEAVAENKSALLVPPSNPAELSGALVKLTDDPQLRFAMGREGRTYVERNFDSRLIENRLLQIYRECIPDL